MEVTKTKRSNTKLFLILGIVVLDIYLLGSVSVDKADRGTTAKRVEKSDALTMMTSAFEGNPSKEAIKATIDKLLTTYQMELSEENYGQVASTLLELRKAHHVPEMEIATCAIHSYQRGITTEFVDAAQLCATVMDEK